MKCQLCGHKNVKKANYCEQCGTLFTKEEKEKALTNGIDGFLRKLHTYYETLTFHFITDRLWFKILSLVLLIGFCLWIYYGKSDTLKIEDSDVYSFQYNTKEKEYYLYIPEEYFAQYNGKVPLNLYVPKGYETLYVGLFNENNELLMKEEKSKTSEIILETNKNENGYYAISLNDSLDNPLKVYIYLGSDAS